MYTSAPPQSWLHCKDLSVILGTVSVLRTLGPPRSLPLGQDAHSVLSIGFSDGFLYRIGVALCVLW